MVSPPGKGQPSVAIVVPLAHKTTYTVDEETSFRHLRRHLGRYDKYVVIPESHPGVYPGLLPKRFPDHYFGETSVDDTLLRATAFYRAFDAYEFVLVYRVGALVFSDALPYWCRAEYDYIANGALSLRRVTSALRVLKDDRSRLRGLLRLLRWRSGTPSEYMPEWRFWMEADRSDGFRVAPAEVAARFNFDAEPRALVRQGPGSGVRLRTRREARAWGDLELDLARLSQRAARVVRS
jgi:uncharacterized protein DUF5672